MTGAWAVGGGDVGGVQTSTPSALLWRRLRADRGASAGLVLVVVLVLVALLAPLLRELAGAPHPSTQDSSALEPPFGSPAGPSGEHLFGVDELGRDVFARVLYGARVSLEVATIATGLATVIGVVAGLLAGYYRGWVDAVISRVIETVLAFPVLLFALGLGAACAGREGCLGGALQPGLWLVILTIAAVSWTWVARIVRGEVLSLREREFVLAARALGASDRRIIFREILPNLVAPIAVCVTVAIPTAILFEAALSFLGVGVQPPDPSWGQMLAESTSSFDTAWWFMLFPGLALVLTVLAFTLIGEGVQNALGARAGTLSVRRRLGAPAANAGRKDLP